MNSRAADVTNNESLLRSEKCLQERVTIILASGRVTGPRRLRYQIKLDGLRTTWKDLIVNPEKTDYTGGNAPGRFERAEGNASAKEIALLLHPCDSFLEVMTHNRIVDFDIGTLIPL